MSPRRLVLRREALTELDSRDLLSVAGGTTGALTVVRTSRCPLRHLFSGMYPSINMDCTATLEELSVDC